MVGPLAAMRWLTHFEADPLAKDVAEMINQALQWEESLILTTGEISTEGNTRTGNGQELTRSGQAKQVNHREVVYGFAYWASMTDNSRWYNTAHQIASYYYFHDSGAVAALTSIAEDSDIPVETPESSYAIGLSVFLSFWLFHIYSMKKFKRKTL